MISIFHIGCLIWIDSRSSFVFVAAVIQIFRFCQRPSVDPRIHTTLKSTSYLVICNSRFLGPTPLLWVELDPSEMSYIDRPIGAEYFGNFLRDLLCIANWFCVNFQMLRSHIPPEMPIHFLGNMITKCSFLRSKEIESNQLKSSTLLIIITIPDSCSNNEPHWSHVNTIYLTWSSRFGPVKILRVRQQNKVIKMRLSFDWSGKRKKNQGPSNRWFGPFMINRKY